MPKGKKAKKRRNANVNYQTYTHNLLNLINMPKGKKAKKRRNANVNYQTYTHNLTKQIRLKKCENAHWRNNPWASCALNQCANLLSNYIQIKQQNVQPLVHAIRLASKSNKQRTAVSLCNRVRKTIAWTESLKPNDGHGERDNKSRIKHAKRDTFCTNKTLLNRIRRAIKRAPIQKEHDRNPIHLCHHQTLHQQDQKKAFFKQKPIKTCTNQSKQ
eukprot:15974_1